MSESIAVVGCLGFVSIVYYIIYKMFKEDSIQDEEYYQIRKSILSGLSLLFQQLFIINTINVVGGLIIVLGDLETLPLTFSFLQGQYTLITIINYIYIAIIGIYLVASFMDSLKKLGNYKKMGGVIKW